MRHTILKHDEGYALLVEEGCPVETFVLHGQMGVTASRTTHNGTSSSFLLIGQENGNLRHILWVTIAGTGTLRPQIHLIALLG